MKLERPHALLWPKEAKRSPLSSAVDVALLGPAAVAEGCAAQWVSRVSSNFFCEVSAFLRKRDCLEENRHVLVMSTPQRFVVVGDDIAEEVALVVDCSTLMRLLLAVPPVRGGFYGASHALFPSGRCRLDK